MLTPKGIKTNSRSCASDPNSLQGAAALMAIMYLSHRLLPLYVPLREQGLFGQKITWEEWVCCNSRHLLFCSWVISGGFHGRQTVPVLQGYLTELLLRNGIDWWELKVIDHICATVLYNSRTPDKLSSQGFFKTSFD